MSQFIKPKFYCSQSTIARNKIKFDDRRLYIIRFIPKDEILIKPGRFLNNNLGQFDLIDDRIRSKFEYYYRDMLKYMILNNTGYLGVDKSNDSKVILMNRRNFYNIHQSQNDIKAKIPMKYWLVDAGVNPKFGTKWYDLVKASNDKEAQLIANEHNLGTVMEELSGNFREAIGQLIYDDGYKVNELKPIIFRNRKKDNL